MADVAGRLYRFPPTREARASYDTVVPEVGKDGEKTRVLKDELSRREAANVTGEKRVDLATAQKKLHSLRITVKCTR